MCVNCNQLTISQSELVMHETLYNKENINTQNKLLPLR